MPSVYTYSSMSSTADGSASSILTSFSIDSRMGSSNMALEGERLANHACCKYMYLVKSMSYLKTSERAARMNLEQGKEERSPTLRVTSEKADLSLIRVQSSTSRLCGAAEIRISVFAYLHRGRFAHLDLLQLSACLALADYL